MNNNRNSSIKFKGNRKNEKCADIAKKKNGIFWVRQGVESSNCRLNALNAFFGYEKLSIIIFERDAAAFDAQFNCSGSKDFTSFGIRTDGILECVVSFVVAKDKEFRCEIYLANQDWDGDASDDLEAIFVFSIFVGIILLILSLYLL